MKQKTKIILMLLLGALILSVLLCTNQVQATTEVTEEYLQGILDKIPNEMNLDIPEVEYEKAKDVIMSNVESILKKNGIGYEKVENEYDILVLKLKDITTNGTEIEIFINGPQIYFSKEDFYTATISIKSKYQKKITIKYNNTKNYNTADEKYVKDLKITNPIYYEFGIENLESIRNEIGTLQLIEKYHTNIIKDNSIVLKFRSYAGDSSATNSFIGEGGLTVAVFRNNVLYELRRLGYAFAIPVINIPSTIEDNKIAEYVINTIKKYNKDEFFKEWINGFTKIEKGINSKDERYRVNIKDGYTIYSADSDYAEDFVIIRRDKTVSKADETTNIKLNTNTDVVPANTILECKPIKEGTIFNTVKTSLEKVADKFTAFDITLKSNGVKVQPNGNVQISIPVPQGYDTNKIIVFRVEDNGTKTKYNVTVKDGYITFETNHFSTYVVAEEKTSAPTGAETTPPVETPKHEKDETPKTGTVDIIAYVSAVTTLAGIGLIAIRKRK